MKKLKDGTEVSERSFFYLLDFNKATNWDFVTSEFKKDSLEELNITEYQILFEIATSIEFSYLENKLIVVNSEREQYKRSLSEDFVIGDLPHSHKLQYQNLAITTHHLPICSVVEKAIIELSPKIDYDLFVRNNYQFNPKTGKSSRVRGEKNKEFKQSIRNLTNNKK
jgi:hypothetical protein